jgi:Nif-specific regulatory protein
LVLNYKEKTRRKQINLLKMISFSIIIRKMRAERNYAEKIEKLYKILGVAKRLGYENEIEKFLEIAIYETSEILDAERSTLFLVDFERNEIWSKIAQDAEINEIRLPRGEGIVGWVIEKGKLVNVEDAYKDKRFNKEIDKLTGYRTRSILCAPIFSREGKVIGAVEALNKKNGSFSKDDEEYITILSSQIGVALENLRLKEQLIKENIILRRELKEKIEDMFVGEHPRIRELLNTVKKVAPSSASVLIRGESGVGKELIAKRIHELSERQNRAFVKVSCAAIPETLLESELFGYEKGAFTGAYSTKKGLLELADGGTVFLDEIGDISPAIQAKLLRVLQEKEFLRIGGTKPIRVDIRVISATNKNLEEAIKERKFREDLFYRLNVVTIHIPPLRERKSDIPLLVHHFIKKYNKLMNRKFEDIEDDAMKVLMDYDWPGNVRELENVIERAIVLGEEPIIRREDILISSEKKNEQPSQISLRDSIQSIEKRAIEEALERARFNISKAAHILGVKRTTFYYKMKRYGIMPKE